MVKANIRETIKSEIKPNKELNKILSKIGKSQSNTNLVKEIWNLIADKKWGKASEKIVAKLEDEFNFYTTKDDLKSEVWVYDSGIYKPHGESFVKTFVRELIGPAYNTKMTNEVIAKLKADTMVDTNVFFENKHINEIPVENGILNIWTKKLSPFAPEKIFFSKLPVKFDPEATCPAIEQFYKDILPNDEDSNLMFESNGYCLLKDYRFAKAFMWVGDGRNGKSKALELTKRFLGAENCASIPLSGMRQDNTSLSDLHGKLVNLAGDLNRTSLKETGMFKQLIGQDLIAAKRKYLRDLYFVNYAKMVFAANELPRVYDFSDGFWDKWVLLTFPYKFISQAEYDQLGEEEKKNKKIRDENIISKLTTEQELSGLLNKSLEALQRVIKNKEFSYTKSSKEVKESWIRKADSFIAFCMDEIVEDSDSKITKMDLRRAFHRYCKKHKVRGSGDKNIKAVLEEMFGAYEDRLTTDDRDRVWFGINWKGGAEDGEK